MPPRFPLSPRLLVSTASSSAAASTPGSAAPAVPASSVASSSSSSASPPSSLARGFASTSSSARPASPPFRERLSFQRRSFHSSRPQQAAAPKDPYKVLGVDSKASANDIKKQYYQLAKQFHPDQNKEKGAKEKFIDIQAAYDTLSDESKRAAYDSYGSASQDPNFNPNFGGGGGSPFGAGGFSFGGDSSFGAGMGGGPTGDLFSSLFGAFGGGGMGGRASRSFKGDDIEASVTISFLEACQGVSRTVQTTPVVECGTCAGSGMKAKAKKETCRACKGTGQRTFVIQSGFQMQSACNACNGVGSVIPAGQECGTCSGAGRVRERKTQKFDIPPGIDDGMSLRLEKSGDLPLTGNGPAGDLLVRVQVLPSREFRRQGSNIYHTARIPVYTAILGGQVTVPTLEGKAEIKVKPGTQHGQQSVLEGRGVASAVNRRSKKGDLIIEYALDVPKLLTMDQRAILEAFANTFKPDYVTPSKPYVFPNATSSPSSSSSTTTSKSGSYHSSSSTTQQQQQQKEKKPPVLEPKDVEPPQKGWFETSLKKFADWLDPPPNPDGDHRSK